MIYCEYFCTTASSLFMSVFWIGSEIQEILLGNKRERYNSFPQQPKWNKWPICAHCCLGFTLIIYKYNYRYKVSLSKHMRIHFYFVVVS